jgi:signal transduction histidine kinase
MLTKTRAYPFLQGGGEMGELTRNYDWSQTVLGNPDDWPQSLRTTLAMILSSRFPMFLWWGADMIQFYNDAYRPSLGNKGKHPQALGQKGIDCWPEIWDIIYPLIYQVQTTGEATWSEDQLIPIFRNEKLEDVYWTFGYSPIYGDADNIDGVLVVCQETTQKVRNVKKLEESEARFQSLIAAAPIAIGLFLGREFTIEMHNQAFNNILDKGNDITGKSLTELFPDLLTENQPFLQILENVFTSGKPYQTFNREVNSVQIRLTKDGFYDSSYTPLFDGEGNVYAILAIAVDVTEQVLAQHQIEEVVAQRTKELAESNKALQQTNQDLEQFAYIASHDMQEPLRKVATFTNLLENSLGTIDERSKRYLHKIGASANRMSQLIYDVLNFSKLSKEGEIYRRVDLNSVVEKIISDFELLIEEKQATITYSCLPVIEAVPLQMQQLFSNLISNALKFSRNNTSPLITIGSRQLSNEEKSTHPELLVDVGYLLVKIEDNGIGFKQEHSKHIFNIFQRLHIKTEYSGTGIGLALCKKIVQNHHGEIWAESNGENGATFNVILPVSHPAASSILDNRSYKA